MKNKKIRTLLDTHHHEDHIGNNRIIQNELGVDIFAHPKTLPFLEHPEKLGLKLYQKFVWGLPVPSTGKPLPELISTDGYELKAIHLPGHSPHHICLLEADKGWLFAGDLYCGRRFKYLRKDENYSEILRPLKLLSQLDFETIFCSLKGQVENGKSALSQKIVFMDELRGNVLMLHQKGLSSRKIRLRLLGCEDKMAFITRGHYAKQNAVDSILLDDDHNFED